MLTTLHFKTSVFINCIKDHKIYFSKSYFDMYYASDYKPFTNVTTYYTSLFLWNSSSVIHNMNINATVNASFTAILVVNVKHTLLDNVEVQLNSLNCTTFNNQPIELSGLKVILYFFDRLSEHGSLTIDNFCYNSYKMCENHSLCVILTMLLLNDKHDVKNRFELKILNSVFRNLKDTSVLCCYGEINEGTKAMPKCYRQITIKNSTFSNNSGKPDSNMFNIVLKQYDHFYHPQISLRQTYIYVVQFYKCTFKRNTNMKALIYVKPPYVQVSTVYIPISNCKVSDNKNMTFIKVELEFQTICYMIIHIMLTSVNVSSNECHHVDNLILIVNGLSYFNSVFFNQNHCYKSLVYLQCSFLFIKDYNEISSNYARHIIKAQSNSFLYMYNFATANISHNTVYKVIMFVSTFEKRTISICPLQVCGRITQNSFNLDVVNCTLLLSNNMEMVSKILDSDIVSYINNDCDWLGRTILQKINANVIIAYHKIIIRKNNTFVNKTVKRLIPLSVCPCLSNNSYNCYMANVYAAYP